MTGLYVVIAVALIGFGLSRRGIKQYERRCGLRWETVKGGARGPGAAVHTAGPALPTRQLRSPRAVTIQQVLDEEARQLIDIAHGEVTAAQLPPRKPDGSPLNPHLSKLPTGIEA